MESVKCEPCVLARKDGMNVRTNYNGERGLKIHLANAKNWEWHNKGSWGTTQNAKGKKVRVFVPTN